MLNRSPLHLLGLACLVLAVAGCGAAPVAAPEPTAPAPTAPAPTAPAPTATAAPAQGRPVPFPLALPPGYSIALYADGLEEVRSVVFAPDGTPYVTVMNRDQELGGKVLALPDSDGDGWADEQILVAADLDRPHGIAWHEGALYVSDASTLYRLADADGDRVAEAREAIVVEMPTTADHWSRPFVFDDAGGVIVAVGSSCNACQEGDSRRATFIRAELGAQTAYADAEVFARGLRSIVDMAYRPGTQELFAVNNARDYLGPELPPDQLFLIEEGQHYGWPYCYGDRVMDPEVAVDHSIQTPDGLPKDRFCAESVKAPALLLPPHAAPLGLVFYTGEQFPEPMHGRLFIAYHGAFDLSNSYGYRVVSVPVGLDGALGTPEDFLTGFMPEGAPRWNGRPLDVNMAPDGSLFITDAFNGHLYRVTYTGP